MNEFWKHGTKRKLALKANISEVDLHHILTRYTRCNPHKAAALAAAASELDLDIPFEHWIWNKESAHPAFKGEPILDMPAGIKMGGNA